MDRRLFFSLIGRSGLCAPLVGELILPAHAVGTSSEWAEQETSLPMDYCEWLKNSSFLTYVGPDYPWGENLACYGTHLEVHHALIHRPPDKKSFHTQNVDPYLYSGVSFVAQITDLELKVGNPLGTVGIYTDGEIVLGRVLKSSANRFHLDFYPHQMLTNLSLKDWGIETQLTYSDSQTFYAHLKITYLGKGRREFSPIIAGRIEPGMQGHGTRSTDYLSVDFTPDGTYHYSYIRIRPSFEIGGWGFSTDGLTDASLKAVLKKGEERFTWHHGLYSTESVVRSGA